MSHGSLLCQSRCPWGSAGQGKALIGDYSKRWVIPKSQEVLSVPECCVCFGFDTYYFFFSSARLKPARSFADRMPHLPPGLACLVTAQCRTLSSFQDCCQASKPLAGNQTAGSPRSCFRPNLEHTRKSQPSHYSQSLLGNGLSSARRAIPIISRLSSSYSESAQAREVAKPLPTWLLSFVFSGFKAKQRRIKEADREIRHRCAKYNTHSLPII